MLPSVVTYVYNVRLCSSIVLSMSNVVCKNAIYIYILAGATRPCPGHYIKIIKCTARGKVVRYVSPKVCKVGSVYLQFLPLGMRASLRSLAPVWEV